MDREVAGVKPQDQTTAAPLPPSRPSKSAGLEVEPEVIPPGVSTVFNFVSDPEWKERIKGHFSELGYHHSEADTAEIARARIRMNDYDVIVIEDRPESALVIEEISTWPGIKRRRANIALLGEEKKSLDPVVAFEKGVNSYLNKADVKNATELLDAVLRSYDVYYRYLTLARKTQESKAG